MWALPSCGGFSPQLGLIKLGEHCLTPTRCWAWCQKLAAGCPVMEQISVERPTGCRWATDAWAALF